MRFIKVPISCCSHAVVGCDRDLYAVLLIAVHEVRSLFQPICRESPQPTQEIGGRHHRIEVDSLNRWIEQRLAAVDRRLLAALGCGRPASAPDMPPSLPEDLNFQHLEFEI